RHVFRPRRKSRERLQRRSGRHAPDRLYPHRRGAVHSATHRQLEVISFMSRLGIIAGGGGLPRILVESCCAQGRDFFVLALKKQADPALVSGGVAHGWARLGAADAALKTLRDAGVGEVVLAGSVRRPSLAELRPDWRTMQ